MQWPQHSCDAAFCASADSEGNTDQRPVPTAQLIEDLELDNIHWRPEQLDQMSNETFVTALEHLGKVPDYSADQLAVLGKKAIEVQLSHQIWRNRQGKRQFPTFFNISHSIKKTFR